MDEDVLQRVQLRDVGRKTQKRRALRNLEVLRAVSSGSSGHDDGVALLVNLSCDVGEMAVHLPGFGPVAGKPGRGQARPRFRASGRRRKTGSDSRSGGCARRGVAFPCGPGASGLNIAVRLTISWNQVSALPGSTPLRSVSMAGSLNSRRNSSRAAGSGLRMEGEGEGYLKPGRRTIPRTPSSAARASSEGLAVRPSCAALLKRATQSRIVLRSMPWAMAASRRVAKPFEFGFSYPKGI